MHYVIKLIIISRFSLFMTMLNLPDLRVDEDFFLGFLVFLRFTAVVE